MILFLQPDPQRQHLDFYQGQMPDPVKKIYIFATLAKSI